MQKLDFSPDDGADQSVTAKLMRSKAFKVLLAFVAVTIVFQVVMTIKGLIPSGSTKILTDGPVTVRQEPMHADIKYLDRADWPMNRKFGDAFTHWSFIAKMDWDLKPIQEKTQPYVFQLQKMTIDLSLPVTIWLPYGVPEKLHDHEMGHLKICEKVYDEAARAALSYGKNMIGRSFVGSGGYAEDAKLAVIRQAHVDFERQFRKQSEDEVNKISEFYDDITHHGLNQVAPEQGVAMAMQKYDEWRNLGGSAAGSPSRPVPAVGAQGTTGSGTQVVNPAGDDASKKSGSAVGGGNGDRSPINAHSETGKESGATTAAPADPKDVEHRGINETKNHERQGK